MFTLTTRGFSVAKQRTVTGKYKDSTKEEGENRRYRGEVQRWGGWVCSSAIWSGEWMSQFRPPWTSLVTQQRIHLQCRRPRFYPWVGKIPWRREWLPTPVSLPGESHGQRSLTGYSPWGHTESDTTGELTLELAPGYFLCFWGSSEYLVSKTAQRNKLCLMRGLQKMPRSLYYPEILRNRGN